MQDGIPLASTRQTQFLAIQKMSRKLLGLKTGPLGEKDKEQQQQHQIPATACHSFNLQQLFRKEPDV